jgi:hypothetical protein
MQQLTIHGQNLCDPKCSKSLLEQKNFAENAIKAKKEALSKVMAANKNVTWLLVTVSFLYILGNLPYTIYYILKEVFEVHPTQMRSLFVVSQTSLNGLIILKIFVYYFYNKPFRKVLNSYCVSTQYYFTQLFKF